MLRNVSSVVIWSIALLIVLGELGVDLAPLLAGSAIIGVALGFGAQTIVRDYLAGLFVVLEDQYGVGDVIDAGAAIGTVEWVSLRLTRLRDADGVVWYVPNGEIKRVGNRSQRRGGDPTDYDAGPARAAATSEARRRSSSDPGTASAGDRNPARPPVGSLPHMSGTTIVLVVVGIFAARRVARSWSRVRSPAGPPGAEPGLRERRRRRRRGRPPDLRHRRPADDRRDPPDRGRPRRRPRSRSRSRQAVEPLPEAPRLRDRLSRTRAAFSGLVGGLRRGGDLDDESWDELEETLLLADVGMATTQRILEGVRARAVGGPRPRRRRRSPSSCATRSSPSSTATAARTARCSSSRASRTSGCSSG